MNGDLDPTLADGLALAGALAVAAGTYVPWIVTGSGTDVVPAIHLSGMEWGIAGQDYLVLGLLVVGLAAAAWFRGDRRGGYLAAATGGAVALSTVYYVGTTLAGWGVFAPGAGVYLTVAGGLLLVVAGWRHVATAEPGRDQRGVGTTG